MKEKQGNTAHKKSKTAMASSRVGVVDKQSGEVLDDGTLIYVPPKLRIRGFFMADQKGFEKLAKSDLNGEAFKVLMLIMGRMDFENVVTISQKEIGNALAMKKQNVSRAMHSLRAAGVFEAEASHIVHMATELGWKGKVKNLHKRNAKAFKDCDERTAPTDADWAKVDERIDALPKFSEAAAML